MLSDLQCMQFLWRAVIRAWRALAGPNECLRALYESCTNSDMAGRFGRFMSGQVGLCRIMSGEVGRKIFFPALFAVTVLHQFLRVWSLFPVLASALRCSSTALTADRLMPHSWRWGQGVGSGRAGLGKVGSGRVRAGSFPFSGLWRLTSHFSSLSLLGTGQLPVLEGSSLAFRFPASGNHGLVTVKIRFQLCHSQFGTLLLYHRYITGFDAIALHSTFGVLRLCPARKAPSGMCRDLGDGVHYSVTDIVELPLYTGT